MTRNLYLGIDEIFRFSSAIGLLLSVGVTVAFNSRNLLSGLNSDVVFSTSILLLPHVTSKKYRCNYVLAVLLAFITVLNSLSDSFGFRAWTTTYSLIVAAAALAFCYARESIAMYKDNSLMHGLYKGSDMSNVFNRSVMAMLYLALAVLSLTSCMGHTFLSIACLVVMSVFFLLQFLRTFDMPRPGKAEVPWISADGSGDGTVMDPDEVKLGAIMKYINEQKPFLDGNFSVDDLARASFSNRSEVSRLINNRMGMNFSTLMNKCRVDYAMEIYKDNPSMSVEQMYQKSGFHSNMTCSTWFKHFTGRQPSVWCREYRDQLRAEQYLSRKKETEQ